MNQQDFLKLFSKNTKKIQYSASDDLKGKKNHTERKFKPIIQREDIEELNTSGHGIYFTVNKFPIGSRTKDKCQRIRAVFVEDDESGKLIKNWPLPPSIIVNSSKGKYHYYWLTNTKNFKEYELVMQTMVDEYHCDKKARDISRVLRLPETFHNKKRKPRLVEVVGGNKKKYNWEVITTAFPPAKTKKSNYVEDETSGFSMKAALEELISTNDLHGSMISIAMSCVNQNMNKQTFTQFMMLAQDKIDYTKLDSKRANDVASRFNEIHLDECYDSAVKKVRGEIETEKVSHKEARVPKFPKNPMKDWPVPWPMIWEEYKKVPRICVPSLLFPTIISIHSYMLDSKYVTGNNRRPNMAFLGIAPSTANKDVNSKEVAEELLEAMKRKGSKHVSLFRDCFSISKLTGDSAFIKSFNKQDFFWLDTEATPLFQMLNQAGANNAHVKALEYRITEVVDGKAISRKGMADSKNSMDAIEDPNCQVLLYAQPKTISEYLSDGIIDSGVFGRMIISIHAGEKDPFNTVFIENDSEEYDIPDELYELYSEERSHNENKIKVKFKKKHMEKMQKWANSYLSKKAGKNENSITVLKRMGITAEQLYAVIVGVAHTYEKLKNPEAKPKLFNPELMLPILEYWVDSKLYGIKEYVHNSIDPVREVVETSMKELIGGKKQGTKIQQKTVRKYAAVTQKMIVARIKRSMGLTSKIKQSCKFSGLSEVVGKTVLSMAKSGEIIEIEIENSRTKYYGFSK